MQDVKTSNQTARHEYARHGSDPSITAKYTEHRSHRFITLYMPPLAQRFHILLCLAFSRGVIRSVIYTSCIFSQPDDVKMWNL